MVDKQEPILNKSCTITAEIEVPKGAEGMIHTSRVRFGVYHYHRFSLIPLKRFRPAPRWPDECSGYRKLTAMSDCVCSFY
jgi:hypothetical protein